MKFSNLPKPAKERLTEELMLPLMALAAQRGGAISDSRQASMNHRANMASIAVCACVCVCVDGVKTIRRGGCDWN